MFIPYDTNIFLPSHFFTIDPRCLLKWLFFKYVANYIADSKKVIMVMINLNHNHVLSIASQFVQFHTLYQHTIQDKLQRQVPQVQNPLHRHDLPQLNAFEESATAVL